MRSRSIRSRLATLFAAAAVIITCCLAVSIAFTDTAHAVEDDKTNYNFKAAATQEELASMPGVYRVQVEPNFETDPKTIGIPSIAKQNLENKATKEMPGIIMGAAVNYEVRTGAIDFTPIGGAELLPPYSYFRWKKMTKEEQGADGQTTTITTLTGFDGSYYIVRIDMSRIIAAVKAKVEATGETLDGKYLHVLQEGNKALLTATGTTDYSHVWANTKQTGDKAAAYSLADDGKAMLDTTGSDNKTPYYDVILMSSAKNVAGADAGGQDTPDGNVNLTFYVDETKDYKPWLLPLDPNNMPQFPYDVKDENGEVIKDKDGNPIGHFETEADYNTALTTKFFDAAKATAENSTTKYQVKGEDLEIDVAVDFSEESPEKSTETEGRYWMGSDMDFWSMEKAIYNEDYDNHTIIMICEVPVLTGLNISGDRKRSVVLDVNSFDIQIANNTEGEQSKAGLTIGSNSSLRIKDGSNTAGAELAIGNNAHMVIEKGGTMYIDETCTAEAEFDAASQTTPSTDPATLLSGEITIKDGGLLSNWGVINIEGTEGKPLDPSQQEQIIRDKQSADILVEEGGILDNYGCISLKGTLHILGMLNNYSKYSDIIHAYDPDKNRIDYHKGIQITWKDDVTQDGVVPGTLYVGMDQEGNIHKDAVVNNYGDIVMCPGIFNLYGTFNNNKHDGLDSAGHLYLCTADEAIIPVQPDPQQNPPIIEKRVTLDPPRESVFNDENGTVNNEGGTIGFAKVALIHNGVLGDLTVLSEDDVIKKEKEAVANAAKAVEEAQKAMDELLKKDPAPTTEEIKTAYAAVVKAQNALTKAQDRLSAAEQVKIQNLAKQVEEMNEQLADLTVVDISNYAAALAKTSYEYTGKAIKPAVTVSGLSADDYTVTYTNNTSIGKATVTITGKEARNFKGTITKTFQITKKTNPLKVSGKKATVKFKALKKKAKTLKASNVIKVTRDGAGTKSYAKASGNKKITVNKKTGKITVKKGLKKGTYKVKIKVKAAGNKLYKPLTQQVTVRIKVK